MAAWSVRNTPFRPGASDLLALLREHAIPTSIVSGGLDFYIHPILRNAGIDLPVYSDVLRVEPPNGLQLSHPYGHPTCRLCGICKAQTVVGRGDDGRRSVFCGDGSTDKYAAEVADIVFARRRLKGYCETSGIPHYAFEEFGPVTQQLRRWIEREEPLPPPAGSDSPIPPARSRAPGSRPHEPARSAPRAVGSPPRGPSTSSIRALGRAVDDATQGFPDRGPFRHRPPRVHGGHGMTAPPHGGRLVHRELSEADRARRDAELADLPKLRPAIDDLYDVQQIAVGSYSPLEGFMDRATLERVLTSTRLPNDLPWSMPILLTPPGPENAKTIAALTAGDDAAILDDKGRLIAMLHLEEKFTPDRTAWAKQTYGTTEVQHPNVADIQATGDVALAGKVDLVRRLDLPTGSDEMTPSDTRALFVARGWNRVAAYQCRNPPHTAHEYLQRLTLERQDVDALLIHPVVGRLKKGDYRPGRDPRGVPGARQVVLPYRIASTSRRSPSRCATPVRGRRSSSRSCGRTSAAPRTSSAGPGGGRQVLRPVRAATGFFDEFRDRDRRALLRRGVAVPEVRLDGDAEDVPASGVGPGRHEPDSDPQGAQRGRPPPGGDPPSRGRRDPPAAERHPGLGRTGGWVAPIPLLGEPAQPVELAEDPLGRLRRCRGPGVDDDLRVLGRLVRVVDPRHLVDLPGPGLLVESLDVPLLAQFERGADVDLDEAPDLADRAFAREERYGLISATTGMTPLRARTFAT